MVRSGDNSLYTGITTNVERRFAEHQSKSPKAARFLKAKSNLQLVLSMEVGDHSSALRLEAAIKKLSKQQKEYVVQDPRRLAAFRS